MKVILAGHNLDFDVIGRFHEEHPEAQDLTPETIAAAYARISRSPKPVDELRRLARVEVEKARQSNRNIVFDMGHSSIAEHAVFNIDIIGVSRLLVEEIEKFRLASYTEKSQRYVLFEDDFVIPGEIADPAIKKAYIDTIKVQNRFYQDLYLLLKPHVFDRHRALAINPSMHSTLDGWAKEDARYIISLATETQLGMTINARNLELMLRRLAAHPLREAISFSMRLYEATKDVAPSLVRYTEATDYDRVTRKGLKEQSAVLREQHGRGIPGSAVSRHTENEAPEPVILTQAPKDADDRLAAHLMHSSTDLPFARCLEIVSRMAHAEKEDLIKGAFRHMRPYDPALREFEHVDLHFEMVISASCFAQMKRHRMATITCQDYDPALGVTMPPAVRESGMEQPFMDMIARTEDTYGRIKTVAPDAAPYVLTNAHRKRVAMKVNARELYHIARLRADGHAQWDIRDIASRMTDLGRKAMPLTLMMATGKDGFNALFEQVMSDNS